MTFDMSGVSVMLAMPAHRDLPWQTALALLETYAACIARGIPVDIRIAANCSLVELARTKLAAQFLAGPCNRLFWVDSDIVWSGDDFLRVLALSTKMEVVGGVYPVKQDEPRFHVASDPAGVHTNEFGCLEMHGFGLGFTCVNRTVMERLAARAPSRRFLGSPEPIPHIFRTGERDGQFVGEDIAFFEDVRALGVPVFLDPSLRLGHVGAKVYSASVLDYMTIKDDQQ